MQWSSAKDDTVQDIGRDERVFFGNRMILYRQNENVKC